MKYDYKKAPNVSELSVKEGFANLKLDHKTYAKDIPCQAACPAKTNVPAYIEEIFKGDYDKAYQINQEDNVFPGVLGRICTRPCEDSCRYNWTNVDGPVQICHLKRYASDNSTSASEPLPGWYKSSGYKVAIIGGGPTGLTAARELKRYGHEVTLFEKEKQLGGMMIDGIPRFRLPREVVESEIDLIVKSGINVELEASVNKEKLDELQTKFDAVLVATGTTLPAQLDIVKDTNEYISYGNEFMKAYNSGEIASLDGDVLIIGGGFTAVDCARSCARAARKLVGEGKNVSIVYRRTEDYMAANYEEIEEIHTEHIEIRTLCTPLEIIKKNGHIEGVKFLRNKIGNEKVNGKPKIIPVENSEFVIPCSYLIVAIGQEQDYSIIASDLKINDDYSTSLSNLFSAGDFLTGSKDVIHAVEAGKDVANKMDKFLTGKERKKYHISVELIKTDGETGRYRDHDLQVPDKMPILDLLQRSVNNAEVETGFSKDSILKNSSRCYFCHYKFEIDQDKCIHCNWCIDVAPRNCIKKVSRVFTDEDGAPTEIVEASLVSEATYIYIDSDECIRCGKCLRVCPTGAISMKKLSRVACLEKE